MCDDVKFVLFCQNDRGSAGRQNGHPETSMVLVVKQVPDFSHAVLAVWQLFIDCTVIQVLVYSSNLKKVT